MAKSSNIIVFAFTFVLKNLALLYGDLCMKSYSVDDNEVMK
jgi:hypothetical protein